MIQVCITQLEKLEESQNWMDDWAPVVVYLEFSLLVIGGILRIILCRFDLCARIVGAWNSKLESKFNLFVICHSRETRRDRRRSPFFDAPFLQLFSLTYDHEPPMAWIPKTSNLRWIYIPTSERHEIREHLPMPAFASTKTLLASFSSSWSSDCPGVHFFLRHWFTISP